MSASTKKASTIIGRAALLFCLISVLLSCTHPVRNQNQVTSPDTLFHLSTKADQAYSESRWLDAARAYQQLTVWVPQDPYSWFRLGNVYARQGLFEEATTAYQASLKRNPAQPKPWYNLATTHLLNAQFALRQSYEHLRPGDPARPLIEQQLIALDGVVYQRSRDADKRGQGKLP